MKFQKINLCKICRWFLIGIHGVVEDALDIKTKLSTFVKEELLMNDEKTLITHATKDKANFLRLSYS
jgi:hypothetical protein